METINNKEYQTKPYKGERLSMFLYKDVLYDELPKGCDVKSYVTLEDGANVGVCTKKTWKIVLLIISVLAFEFGCVFLISYVIGVIQDARSVQKSDVEVIDDSTESAVISVIKDTDYVLRYNRYTILTDGYIDIMYQNIDKEVTLYIEDVECEPLTVKPDEYIPVYAVKLPEDVELPMRAKLIVKIEGTKYTVPIVINDKDSIEYQQMKENDKGGNKVNLNDASTTTDGGGSGKYENDDWNNPSTFVTEERTIHD